MASAAGPHAAPAGLPVFVVAGLLAFSPVACVRRDAGWDPAGDPPAGVPASGRGLPEQGAWALNKTRWLAREELGRCIRPELSPDDGLAWLEELRDEASKAVKEQRFNSQSWRRPLYALFGEASEVMPYHRAIVFTSGRYRQEDTPEGHDYPGSRCYDFDYDAPAGGRPDPHGCHLFRRSFRRLKSLRTCIAGALEKSPNWAVYRHAVTTILARREAQSVNATNPNQVLSVDDVEDESFQDVVRGCSTSFSCALMDASRRADEMITHLSWQSWATQTQPLRTWVESQVRRTASIHEDAGEENVDPAARAHVGLEQDVVDSIVGTCLGVPKDADGMAYDQLPEETRLLERSLSCNALMLDGIQVPGAPLDPVSDAVTMWDPSLVHKGELLFDLKSVTPVCGRAAAAMAVYDQLHSRDGYTVLQCSMGLEVMGLREKPWGECVDIAGMNCICLEMCWRSAVRRVCELAADCCPGDLLS